MRICMLAYAFYESDTRIRQYVTALTKRGDVIDVIALRREGQPDHEVVDGVNVYRIQQREHNERGRRPVFLLRLIRFMVHSGVLLVRKHLENPYQLVHVHSVPDFLVFSAAPLKIFGTRIILDIHDILPEFHASKFKVRYDSLIFKFLVFVERLSAAISDHVIIANHIWQARLTSRSARPEKCTVIRNYPDPILFHPYPKEKNKVKFVITYPGTLNWHQGVDIAIKAFAKVAAQAPEAQFQIYGEGPALTSLVSLADELGLSRKVVFKPFVSVREIVNVMANSDLAVVPKRASSPFGNEAASTKIMEFMALGVPVIVSRTKIDSEYFDESLVRFFESDNVEDLAECILLLRRDRRLRERLASNAMEYVSLNSWEEKKEDYLNLVDSLVKRGEAVRSTSDCYSPQ